MLIPERHLFSQWEKILRHVSQSLAARSWETPAMQILDELAEEFSSAVRLKQDNTALGLLSFGT